MDKGTFYSFSVVPTLLIHNITFSSNECLNTVEGDGCIIYVKVMDNGEGTQSVTSSSFSHNVAPAGSIV